MCNSHSCIPKEQLSTYNDKMIQKLQKSWRPVHFGQYCNHVISRAGFTLCWGPGTLRFLQYFPSTYKLRPKKSYLSAGPLALCHMLNPSLVIPLRS